MNTIPELDRTSIEFIERTLRKKKVIQLLWTLLYLPILSKLNNRPSYYCLQLLIMFLFKFIFDYLLENPWSFFTGQHYSWLVLFFINHLIWLLIFDHKLENSVLRKENIELTRILEELKKY